MAITCPKCGKLNPDNARFCWNDGEEFVTTGFRPFQYTDGSSANSIEDLIVLIEQNWDESKRYLYSDSFATWFSSIGRGDLTLAAQDIVQSTKDQDTALRKLIRRLEKNPTFRFNDGTKASTIPEFVSAIDKNWDEGKRYFYNHDDLADWLEVIQRDDLANTARQIISSESDQDIGLEKFFQSLGSGAPPNPQLSVSQTTLDFGEVDVENISRANYTVQFTITNSGRGHLYGTISSSEPWIEVDVKEFSGNQINVRATIVGLGPPAHLEIQSNGGVLSIPVNIAPTLKLGEVGEKDFLVPKAFEIMSTGDCESRTSASWLQLETSANSISVSAKPSKAGIGSNQGSIVISDGADTMRLNVELIVRPAPFYIKHRLAIGISMVSAILIALLGYYVWVNIIQFNRLDTTNNPYLAMKYLGSGNDYRAARATQALVRIGDPSVAPLIDALASDNRQKSNKAATTLEELGEVAVTQLIKALEHRNYRVRTSAVEILGRMGDTRAVEPLIKVLKQRTVSESYVAKALKKLAGPHLYYYQDPQGTDHIGVRNIRMPIDYVKLQSLRKIDYEGSADNVKEIKIDFEGYNVGEGEVTLEEKEILTLHLTNADGDRNVEIKATYHGYLSGGKYPYINGMDADKIDNKIDIGNPLSLKANELEQLAKKGHSAFSEYLNRVYISYYDQLIGQHHEPITVLDPSSREEKAYQRIAIRSGEPVVLGLKNYLSSFSEGQRMVEKIEVFFSRIYAGIWWKSKGLAASLAQVFDYEGIVIAKLPPGRKVLYKIEPHEYYGVRIVEGILRNNRVEWKEIKAHINNRGMGETGSWHWVDDKWIQVTVDGPRSRPEYYWKMESYRKGKYEALPLPPEIDREYYEALSR